MNICIACELHVACHTFKSQVLSDIKLQRGELQQMHVMTHLIQPKFDVLKKFGRIDDQQEQLSVDACHLLLHLQFFA